MKHCFAFVLLLALSLQVACSKKSSSSSREVSCRNGELMDVGIVGGQALNDQSWLAKGLVALVTKSVNRYGNEVFELCTGTLIDRNIILTAAHCVAQRKNGQAENVHVAFSVDLFCLVDSPSRDQLIKNADSVIVHESYINVGKGDDIALIRLSEDAPTNFHTVNMVLDYKGLSNADKIFVSGYGVETDYNSNEEHSPRLKVAEVNPYRYPGYGHQEFTSTVGNDSAVLVFDQRQGQGACAGDSGGPALIKTNYGLNVIGVASRVDGLDYSFERQSDVTCSQGSVYTSLYYHRDWIVRNRSLLRN